MWHLSFPLELAIIHKCQSAPRLWSVNEISEGRKQWSHSAHEICRNRKTAFWEIWIVFLYFIIFLSLYLFPLKVKMLRTWLKWMSVRREQRQFVWDLEKSREPLEPLKFHCVCPEEIKSEAGSNSLLLSSEFNLNAVFAEC